MADEIIIKYKADIEGLKTSFTIIKNEVETLQKQNEELQKKLDDTFKKPTGGAKTLQSELKKLKIELANATDPKEIERLARAAGELADKIGDASDAAKVFASESKFEQIGNAFGSVVSKVRSLDFKGALDQSKLLLATAKGLTFKEALTGLKDIVGTVKNIGQAILTSPLFLIGGAIAGAVMVFNDLEESSARVNQTYLDGLDILKQSRDASEAYRKAQRDLAIENKAALGEITELEANRLKGQNKYQDEYKKLLLERQTREKEALEQAEKDREEDGFRRTKQLFEFFGGETDITKAQKQKLKDIETAFQNSVKDLNQLFIEEDKKSRIANDAAKLKEQQDLNKRFLEEQQRLAKVLRDLQTQNIESDYERRKQIILNNFDDEAAKYKGHNDIIVELEKKKNRELNDLALEREAKNKKILEDAQKDYIKIYKDGIKDIEGADVGLSESFKQKMDQRLNDEKELEDGIKKLKQDSIDFQNSLISQAFEAQQNFYQREIIENKEKADEAISVLDNELATKQISQEVYNQRKAEIEKKAAEEEAKLRRRAFESQKQAAYIQAIISTAQGVANALTVTPAQLVPAYIAIALATGAAQIATISSQPTPKFEKGGWIDGKRHSQGGTIIEAEKDEYVINRKDAIKNASLLEAINSGTAEEFINQKFIAPVLREQERKYAEAKDSAFADNIVNSMLLNSGQFKDSNLLESLKRSRQSDRENAIFIVKELTKRTSNSRSW